MYFNSVWRTIRGPNTDWPLALCDYETLDVGNDIEFIDFVGRDSTTEGIELFYNPNQKWYFLDRQMPEEVFVFCNTDSRSINIPCT